MYCIIPSWYILGPVILPYPSFIAWYMEIISIELSPLPRSLTQGKYFKVLWWKLVSLILNMHKTKWIQIFLVTSDFEFDLWGLNCSTIFAYFDCQHLRKYAKFSLSCSLLLAFASIFYKNKMILHNYIYTNIVTNCFYHNAFVFLYY